MRALIATPTETGPTLTDLPTPTPAAGEVLVQVTAATVNPIDALVAAGPARELFGVSENAGLGWDFAGVVDAVGDGVTDFAIGERVAGLNANPSDALRGQSEYVAIAAGALARIPDALGDAEAASAVLNALTAAQIVDMLGPGAGKSLLVTGAGGAVGGYLLVLARNAGWAVTGLARESDGEFVTGTGASFATELQPQAFDAVADAAGMQEAAIAAARDGGVFVGVLPPLPVTPERGIDVSAVFVQPDGVRLGSLLEQSASGELQPRVAERVPFAEFERAYELVAQPGRRGRVVLAF